MFIQSVFQFVKALFRMPGKVCNGMKFTKMFILRALYETVTRRSFSSEQI